MLSFKTECPCCKRSFKILYSLPKHVRERHQGEEYFMNPAFKDGDGNVTTLPTPQGNLDPKYQEGYRLWIGSLVERMKSTFHPCLPGKLQLLRVHYVETCHACTMPGFPTDKTKWSGGIISSESLLGIKRLNHYFISFQNLEIAKGQSQDFFPLSLHP